MKTKLNIKEPKEFNSDTETERNNQRIDEILNKSFTH